MKKLLLLSFIIQLSWLASFAQSFYVGNIEYPDGFPVGIVHKITITPGGVVSTLVNSCSGSYFFSLAMNRSGFYWLDGPKLFKGDIVGNDLINCKQIGAIEFGSNSLTAGADGDLYYVEDQLKKINPATGVITPLGIPNYFPSGDLTFYNNELYMASDQGIVKVNSREPGKSTLIINTQNYGLLFGFVSVATDLHKNSVYGLLYVSETQTDILAIDLENNKVTGKVGSLPYAVLDASSPSENGSISGIKINRINLHQDCSAPTRGSIEIITQQHEDAFTYTLNTGQSNTTGIFNNMPAGDYKLTIKSANDQQTADVTVPVYKLVKPVYTYKIKNQGCEADGEVAFTTNDNFFNVKLGADVFPLTHTFSALTSGQNYHFEILNENGCLTDALDLSIPKDKCTIQFDKIAITKECSSASNSNLQVITKPHTLAYNYKLNELSNTTGLFNQMAPGHYMLKITSAEDELIMPVELFDFKLQHPAITYATVNPSCSDKGTIKFNINGDVNLYRVKSGETKFPVDHLFSGLDKGIHHFTIITQNDCVIDEYDIDLKYQPCPIVITQIDNKPECNVFSKGILQVFAAPIPETLSYDLNGITNQTGVFNMLDPGTYQLTVSASGGGTPQTKTIIVPDYRLTHPTIDYVAINPACKDKGTVKFTIADALSLYRIKLNAEIYPMDHLFTNLEPGAYRFSIIKENGCLVDEYDINLMYQPCPIVINKIEMAPECNVIGKGLMQVFISPIPEDLTYQLENTTNTTGVFNMMEPGTYQLTVTASGGGTPQKRSVVIPDYTINAPKWTLIQKNPVCDIPGTVQIKLGDADANYNIGYNSSIFPTSHVFTNLYAGTYHFTVLKKDNCIATELDVTMVQETCSPVTFPNTFTPNQDGRNDIFQADPESKATDYRLQIFDRWGTKLFLSSALATGWDGNYNGKPVPLGVYYWMATYITQENNQAIQKGSVTLLR